jgi:hypothetical protein
MSNSIRQGVTEEIDSQIVRFLYGTGMSLADMAFASMFGGTGGLGASVTKKLGGKFGAKLIGKIIGGIGSGTFMGLEAASSTTNDVLDRGGTEGQAVASGVMAGVFEGLFEAFSLGELKAMKGTTTVLFKEMIEKTGKSGFKVLLKRLGIDALKSAGVNASEEMLTEIANITYDTLANRDISNYALMVDKYMNEDGLSEKQAKRKSITDFTLQVLEAGASGALMGLILGGGESIVSYQDAKSTTSKTIAKKEHISLEEFANNEAKVWKNVDYNDNDTKTTLMQEAHTRMVEEGSVVKVPEDTQQQVGESFPDLRTMKKKERTSILKESMDKLKTNLRQFLNGFKNQEFEFNVNGKVLEATLYNTGINEVLEKITQKKANMLYSTEEIFKNAQYLYSTSDYAGDPNVYRWNYFYTPVEIGNETVGVRIAVRDMVKGTEGDVPESQIYNWGIKKDVSLDGGSHSQTAASSGVSSDTSYDTSLDGVGRGNNRISHGISSNVSNNRLTQKPSIVNNIISNEGGNNSSASDSDTTLPENIKEISIANKNKQRHHTTLKEQNYIIGIGKALGRTVVFENVVDKLRAEGIDLKGQIPDGYIDNNGVIHMNFTVIDPLTFIFKHELTHFGEGTEAYNKFVDAVRKSDAFKNWLIEKTGLNTEDNTVEVLIAAARQSVMDSRTGDGTVDVEGAMAEVIADFVGDCLFTDNGSKLESMLSNLDVKERNVVIQYILDFLSYIKKRLAGNKDIEFEISRLEDSFNRMLSEATQAANQGDLKTEGNRYTFARSYDTDAIAEAEDIESQGVKHPEIWGKTGLMRDGGGTWVYEIDDFEMEFDPKGHVLIKEDPDYEEFVKLENKADDPSKKMTKRDWERLAELDDKFFLEYGYGLNKIEEYVKHDKLFEVYPQLKDIKIEFRDLGENGYGGYYSHSEKKIVINEHSLNSKDPNRIKKTLIHELQHAVQYIDSREEGSNKEFWNARILNGERMPINYRTGRPYTAEETYDAYLDTAGEMEARAAAERFDYTEKERGYSFFAPDIDYNNSVRMSEFKKETVPTAMAEGYIEAVNSNDINTAQRLVDQAAKKLGYTKRLYHQTGKEFTEFNTNNQIGGKYDWELPTGTFLKPSNNDIGLSGKKQMELYAKFENALVFKNRSEARKFWVDNIPEYKKIAQELTNIDSQYRRKTDEAMDNVHQYLKQWKQKNPTTDSREIYSDSEYQRLNDLEDKIVDEWEEKSNEASLRAKELLDDFISNSDFDGIVVENDEGSYGRSTKTYIVFDSSQLKDASPVTYDDNGNVIPLSARFDSNKKDIRYSIPRNINIDNTGLKRDNISRANIRGENVNEFYSVLDKGQWHNFYQQIADKGYLQNTSVGDLIVLVVNDKLLIAERQMTGKDAHDFQVFDAYKVSDYADSYILNEIKDILNESGVLHDNEAAAKTIFRTYQSFAPESALARFNRNNLSFDTDVTERQETFNGGKSDEGFGDEPKRNRVSNENEQNLQGTENGLDNKFQLNRYSIPSQANSLLDRYENGEISREDYQQQLDELWKSANEEYGTIKQGENAKTPLAIPKAVEDGMPTKQFVRTVIETGKLTSEMIEDIEQEVLLGDTYSYKVVSDESAKNKAEKSFEKGIAEESWNKAISTKAISKEDIAIGEKLLLQAIEDNNRLKVIELSAELADAFTRSGQVVQAARMLKKMSGVGRLVAAQKNVNTINKSLQEKYGDKSPTVKLNPLLAEQLAKTKTTREIEMVYGEVLSDIASQVPATWLDKLNAWRYFAMLSNPRTHIRNLVSNTVFTPSIMLKRFIATGAEHILIKDADKRTKAVFIKKEYMDFAKKDIKNREVKNMLQGKGQLDDKAIIEELRKTFETKWLESLTKGNGNLLEAEDMWFKSHHYKVAFASFLQARKVNLKSVSETTLREAREYAVNEAKKSTFQDFSKLANWLNNIKNPVGRIAVEGVLPFKRTPINIIKRGVEYSPIGLMEKLTVGLLDVRKGKITVSEFCDGLAAGITGTGFVAIGWILASAGMVVGSSGDDEEDKFKQLNGEQEYAVQIFDKSYTVDWAAPAAIPFFIGVELAGEIDENDGFEFKDLTDSFWNALEPITNLSMLSGVQGLIETVKYEDSSKTIGTMIGDVATNFAMQLIPSSFGAIARTIDETQRTWYTDKNSSLDSFSQSVINNAKSKVPGLSYTQIPKIDAWGREVKRGSVGERIAENFISPGYYSEVDYSEAEKELKRLWKSTGENVFPKTAAKYFQVNGETKHLTADEYVEYAKAKGEYSFDYIKEFVNGSAYDKLADSEKAEVIKNLYEYANAKAKTEVSDYDIMKQYKTVTNWERNGKSAVVYYISKAIN